MRLLLAALGISIRGFCEVFLIINRVKQYATSERRPLNGKPRK